jgi:hypothetical protein
MPLLQHQLDERASELHEAIRSGDMKRVQGELFKSGATQVVNHNYNGKAAVEVAIKEARDNRISILRQVAEAGANSHTLDLSVLLQNEPEAATIRGILEAPTRTPPRK